ncbi:MAG: hypothetical protein KatS3mg014_2516 [Actinomycetota bacterium]|nr:MAG: hypothetical protein KatS3mg014_2489 [Actinomycetota bacterium]GIV00901.1 MAG: hypothetical protein KatS3mg014_2516 [Actinomycetota bacterium]
MKGVASHVGIAGRLVVDPFLEFVEERPVCTLFVDVHHRRPLRLAVVVRGRQALRCAEVVREGDGVVAVGELVCPRDGAVVLEAAAVGVTV